MISRNLCLSACGHSLKTTQKMLNALWRILCVSAHLSTYFCLYQVSFSILRLAMLHWNNFLVYLTWNIFSLACKSIFEFVYVWTLFTNVWLFSNKDCRRQTHSTQILFWKDKYIQVYRDRLDTVVCLQRRH